MDFWKDCPDEVLITIFKNFNLKTRLKAGLTCRRWYELLKDPRANMENVSDIHFQINTDIKRLRKKIWQTTLEEIIKTTMEGLSNHVGKAENFHLDEDDSNILSLISKMVNDGLLKIDQFSSDIGDDFSITDWINAISPSTIRELDLFVENDPELLICDWSLFPELERLILYDISIDLSTTSSPSLLKYLKMGFSDDNRELAGVLNTTLSFLPKLEELHISDHLYFDDESFRNFLITIKNQLSNLRRLYFGEKVAFNLSNMTAISNEFKYEFTLDSLEEIEFINDDFDRDENWMDVIKLFSRICTSSAIIHVSTRLTPVTIITAYEGLAALTTRGNTNSALNIDFTDFEDGTNDIESLTIPSEFGRALINLSVRRMKSTIFLQKFFNCNSYEKLIEINFHKCDGLNDEILKIVAQSCLRLKDMNISNCKGITENGLKSFLINWDQRQSKQLSIMIDHYDPAINMVFNIDSPIVNIDRLFGVSFEEGRGILDESWMMEEENKNEGPSSKKQKISMENRKRWALYRKMEDRGIRLVIWDQGTNSLNGVDQKILVIKNNYNFSFSNRIAVNPI